MVKSAAIAAVAAVFATAAGCSSDAARSDARTPSVILIVLDTLRADHLGCYGYERGTSPNIDAFASGATRYAHAMSTAPWTLPSHASMFTGKYPFEHGAHSFKVERFRKRNANPLDARELTLAEALRDEGYQTAAFVCNIGYLGKWTQLDQGFDVYELPRKIISAKKWNPRIFEWLEKRRDKNKPFFLFVNFMDVHRPYNSAARPGFLEPKGHPGKLLTELTERVMPGKLPPPKDLQQQVIDHYDTALANLDEQVQRLLDKLKELELYDDSIVIVAADHGEYFGEHALVEHSKDLYQPAVAVPLIVKNPRQRSGGVNETPVDLTVLPNLVVSQLPAQHAKRLTAAFPNAPGVNKPFVENYYSRTKDLFGKPWSARFDRIRTATYDWPYKYIRSSDGANECYDLEHDPGELENLLVSRPDLTRRLAAALDAFEQTRRRAQIDTATVGEHTAAELKAMRDLGYVGNDDESDEAATTRPASDDPTKP